MKKKNHVWRSELASSNTIEAHNGNSHETKESNYRIEHDSKRNGPWYAMERLKRRIEKMRQ